MIYTLKEEKNLVAKAASSVVTNQLINQPVNHHQISKKKKLILIPKIKNMKGETITTRKGIANVFAEFYEKIVRR